MCAGQSFLACARCNWLLCLRELARKTSNGLFIPFTMSALLSYLISLLDEIESFHWSRFYTCEQERVIYARNIGCIARILTLQFHPREKHPSDPVHTENCFSQSRGVSRLTDPPPGDFTGVKICEKSKGKVAEQLYCTMCVKEFSQSFDPWAREKPYFMYFNIVCQVCKEVVCHACIQHVWCPRIRASVWMCRACVDFRRAFYNQDEAVIDDVRCLNYMRWHPWFEHVESRLLELELRFDSERHRYRRCFGG